MQAQASAEETAQVATASAANEDYCTGGLQKVLRRVLKSCGLLDSGTVRGCQPADAKTVATMSGSDFNALFRPMKERGGIIMFDQESADLDAQAQSLVDEIFADQRGASYFFVVSRSSPEGATEFNRTLSKGRAQAVMDRLHQKFDDPDLKKEVGLLWLGEEFAQLDKEFCEWRHSRGESCTEKDLNRSAFIAWIDCKL
jgi:outer membrane protein OmpA-like peptidoglycan-associated protein